MKIEWADGPEGRWPVSVTMLRPDDMHLHLRDGAGMHDVALHTARAFSRAIVMPNLKPPVATVDRADAYQERILGSFGSGQNGFFEPLMTLYLTESMLPSEINRAKESGFVHGVKYYPAGATTNSDAGVTDLDKVHKVLERMQEVGMPLLMHGEVKDAAVDVFDLEKVFIDKKLVPFVRRYPRLKIVLEHITTKQGVQFVESHAPQVAATITPHHLLANRNAIFEGGLRVHNYCLPVLKREEHRIALLKAATSGNSSFFLGTDSAPHPRHLKETSCGCAGVYNAYGAMELYAEAFASIGKLDKLEQFASMNGSDFYGLPHSTQTITLVREESDIPAEFKFGEDVVVPFRAGEKLWWKLQ